MKLRTMKKILAEYAVNHLLVGTRFFLVKRKLLCSIGYEIGENTKIVGPLYNTGSLHIGKNCWIGRNLTIHGNGSVFIGDNCDIAPDVTFLTGGHLVGDYSRRAGQGESYRITLGNGVWIGARATLLLNICVGEGSVVAACSCVHKNIQKNTLAAGVPAKTIKELDNGITDVTKEQNC